MDELKGFINECERFYRRDGTDPVYSRDEKASLFRDWLEKELQTFKEKWQRESVNRFAHFVDGARDPEAKGIEPYKGNTQGAVDWFWTSDGAKGERNKSNV